MKNTLMSNGQRVRRWTFTLNNPNGFPPSGPVDGDASVVPPAEAPEVESETWVSAQLSSHGKGFRYLVFQLEQGSNGTPHYQGYVEFNYSTRFAAVKRMLPRAHWEPAQGTSAHNKHYCSKPVPGCDCAHCASNPVRLLGPWEHGSPGEEKQGFLRRYSE